MNTIVTVKEGALEGAFSDDKQSVIFKGVPYAAPPVGELRWKRPQPHAKWEGVRPALEFSAKAPQADLSKMGLYGKEFYSDENLKRSEDCLYLNIWTPASAQPGDKLPVFFWIHGGAFTHGSGAEKEFDGEQFARNGVVFVSINYRVGALGFFAHPELDAENPEGISGNYGIYDQVAAIDWVYENIAAFGGDPDCITAAGQSAGCMSVQTLISSDLTRGKIKRAVLQSAGGLGGLSHDISIEMRVKSSKELMEKLGAKNIEEMRAVLAEKIAEHYYEIPKDQRNGKCQITVSTSFFVPKPFTPFQWAAQITPEEYLRRVHLLQANLHAKCVDYRYHESDLSRLEAVMARGDRRVGKALLEAHNLGCRLDGWDEDFDYEKWLEAFRRAGLDPDFYTTRGYGVDEILPWQTIDVGVTTNFLLREREKALRSESTPDCRTHCNGCGARRLSERGLCDESPAV